MFQFDKFKHKIIDFICFKLKLDMFCDLLILKYVNTYKSLFFVLNSILNHRLIRFKPLFFLLLQLLQHIQGLFLNSLLSNSQRIKILLPLLNPLNNPLRSPLIILHSLQNIIIQNNLLIHSRHKPWTLHHRCLHNRYGGIRTHIDNYSRWPGTKKRVP